MNSPSDFTFVVPRPVRTRCVSDSKLIKPLALAFQASLGRRIGTKNRVVNTPDTPIKRGRRKSVNLFDKSNPFGEHLTHSAPQNGAKDGLKTNQPEKDEKTKEERQYGGRFGPAVFSKTHPAPGGDTPSGLRFQKLFKESNVMDEGLEDVDELMPMQGIQSVNEITEPSRYANLRNFSDNSTTSGDVIMSDAQENQRSSNKLYASHSSSSNSQSTPSSKPSFLNQHAAFSPIPMARNRSTFSPISTFSPGPSRNKTQFSPNPLTRNHTTPAHANSAFFFSNNQKNNGHLNPTPFANHNSSTPRIPFTNQKSTPNFKHHISLQPREPLNYIPSTPTPPRKPAFMLMRTPNQPQPSSFSNFEATPTRNGQEMELETSPIDCSPIFNRPFIDAQNINFPKCDADAKKKHRSPLNESPKNNKRQHCEDALMASPTSEQTVHPDLSRLVEQCTVAPRRKFPPSLIPVPRKHSGTYKFINKVCTLPSDPLTVSDLHPEVSDLFINASINPTTHEIPDPFVNVSVNPVTHLPTNVNASVRQTSHIPYYVLFSSHPVFLDSNFFQAADGKREALTRITANLAAYSGIAPSYFETFTIIDMLGGGTFGDALKVSRNGVEYAIKRNKKPFSGIKDAYYFC